MKKVTIITKTKTTAFASMTLLLCVFCSGMFAGNKDRAGEAGATELTINPWAKSSGWAGVNTACVRGLEAIFGNVAGTAFTQKTELLAVHTSWLVGSGMNVNAFGFTQHVGTAGVIGLGIMSMGFGDINITTTETPEGNIGKFSPQYINLNLSYAKAFSDNIYGGIVVKSVAEQISDVRASGMAVDAGIQYVTGDFDRLKFGITLRNVGPKMVYKGDGISFRTPLPNNPTGSQNIAVEQRSASFELPTMLAIGASYDLYAAKDSMAIKTNRFTVAGNFTSNSFGKDEIKIGLEYGWKSLFSARAGYSYEQGIFSSDSRTNAHTGPCAGITVETPFKKGGQSRFAIDYSYRVSNPFQGTHSIGLRITM